MYRRAVFVLAVAVLTALGIVATGDPGAQWWIPLLPAVLLLGRVRRPGRLRGGLQRAAGRGRLAVMPGRVHPGPVTSRGQTVRLVTPTGDAVGVTAFPGVAETLARWHVGQPASLVWIPRPLGRGPAALVLTDSLVAYLERLPRGARSVAVPVRLGTAESTLVPARR
ncbi:MAG TPA: hypothetical protein VFX70_18790 [Mycobacteriales bacterium]|nr:hypothetical protein [Mycobacteriales bacterium]